MAQIVQKVSWTAESTQWREQSPATRYTKSLRAAYGVARRSKTYPKRLLHVMLMMLVMIVVMVAVVLFKVAMVVLFEVVAVVALLAEGLGRRGLEAPREGWCSGGRRREGRMPRPGRSPGKKHGPLPERIHSRTRLSVVVATVVAA